MEISTKKTRNNNIFFVKNKMKEKYQTFIFCKKQDEKKGNEKKGQNKK